MGILGILEIPINIFHFLSGKYYILGISSLQEITGWGLWGFVKSHLTLFCIFLLADWQVLHIDIQHFKRNHGMGIGIAPWGFWGFWNPIQHFFTCLLVSITYWESVPYKKSQDGDYGDLSNPIWHFLHFSFLLVGKSYILVISILREITGWGTWGYEKSPWTCFLCDVAFFFLLFGMYYILVISTL